MMQTPWQRRNQNRFEVSSFKVNSKPVNIWSGFWRGWTLPLGVIHCSLAPFWPTQGRRSHHCGQVLPDPRAVTILLNPCLSVLYPLCPREFVCLWYVLFPVQDAPKRKGWWGEVLSYSHTGLLGMKTSPHCCYFVHLMCTAILCFNHLRGLILLQNKLPWNKIVIFQSSCRSQKYFKLDWPGLNAGWGGSQ